MDRQSYAHLAEVFAAVCDLDPESQQRQLAAIRAEDVELADHLERLLAADAAPTRVLDTRPDEGAARLLAADMLDDESPETLGSFRIIRKLGSGGMGVVYEAEEAHPRRRVAVKTLHPWLRTGPHVELFRFEAQAMGNLAHPGIPQVYAAGEDDGIVYLVMELVRGAPLLDAAQRMGLRRRVLLVPDICDAVQHAHDAGVVHRDLKPQNILVTDAGQPKVLDFGIAMPLLAARLAEATGALGTLAYASPEQIERGGACVRADIYALGAVAYELLTGTVPHDVAGLDPAAAALRKRSAHVPACARLPALSPDIGWVIDQALSVDPANRLRSAGAISADLRRAIADLPIADRRGPARRAQLWARRNRRSVRAALAVVAVLVGAGGAVYGWNAWRQAGVEAAAMRDLDAMNEALDLLVAREAWADAEALFGMFTARPEHRGTAALSRAWREHAARRKSAGQDGVVAALAEAWIERVDEETTLQAGLDLAAEMRADGRFGAAWSVLNALSDTPSAALVEARISTALSRRDFGAVATLDGGDSALQSVGRALSKGVRLEFTASEAEVVRVGDRDLLLTVEADHHTWIRTLDGTVLGRLEHPPAVRVDGRNLSAGDGAIWLAGLARSDDGLSTNLFRATLGDLKWAHYATLPPGFPAEMRVADLGGGDRAWVALAYPFRGLRSVSLHDAAVTTPHHATDLESSDVTGVVIADLDRDGTPELAASVTDWYAYDVRVYRPSGPGILELRARAPLGHSTGVVALPRAGRTPLLGALKVDQIRNERVFGASSPYGPAPGLYLYALEGDTLARQATLPMPPIERAGEHGWSSAPSGGDVDGDGRHEVFATTFAGRAPDSRDLLVAVDAAGAGAELRVVAGMQLLAVADHDADGDDELLVRMEDGALWLLGTGHTTPPRHEDSVSVAPTALESPPSRDRSVVAAWARASALLDLGLVREAGASLHAFAVGSREPAVRARAAAVAARLREDVGDDDGAADAWRVAVSALEGGAPDDVAVRQAAVQNLVRGLHFDEAWSIARKLPEDPARSWIAVAAVSPEVTLLPPGPIDERWTIHVPEAISTAGPRWTLDTIAGEGEILTTSLELQGDRVGLRLEMDVDVAELGSGIAVDLVDARGSTALMLRAGAHGGGGLTTVDVACSAPAARRITAADLPAAPFSLPLGLRAEWLDGTGRQGCLASGGAKGAAWGLAPSKVPAGRYTLRVRTAGDPGYTLASRMRAHIRSLVVSGASWPPVASPNAEEMGRRALVHGDLRGAAAALVAPADRVWAAVRLGETDQAAQDLRALRAAGDLSVFGRLLRREDGATQLIADTLGAEFGPLAAGVLTEPFRQNPWRADVQRAAAHGALDGVPVDNPTGAAFQVARAGVLRASGDAARARAVAESVVRASLPPDDVDGRRAQAAAHHLLAELVDPTDPARAETHRLRADILERGLAR